MAVISLILRQKQKQRSFNSVLLKIVPSALALQQTWVAIASPSQTAHCSLATANTSPTSAHVYICKLIDKPMRHILKLLQSNSSFHFSYASKNNKHMQTANISCRSGLTRRLREVSETMKKIFSRRIKITSQWLWKSFSYHLVMRCISLFSVYFSVGSPVWSISKMAAPLREREGGREVSYSRNRDT